MEHSSRREAGRQPIIESLLARAPRPFGIFPNLRCVSVRTALCPITYRRRAARPLAFALPLRAAAGPLSPWANADCGIEMEIRALAGRPGLYPLCGPLCVHRRAREPGADSPRIVFPRAPVRSMLIAIPPDRCRKAPISFA